VKGFSESLAAEVAHLGIRVTILEPQPFRMRGKQPGDPARAAHAIIQAVEAVRPSHPCGCHWDKWHWITSGQRLMPKQRSLKHGRI
jgi:NAD(P)-dependent dehydrogenase (short-subunit alcohol dehydrogenase family)